MVIAARVLVHDQDEWRRAQGRPGPEEIEQLGFEIKPFGVRKRRRIKAPKQAGDQATDGACQLGRPRARQVA